MTRYTFFQKLKTVAAFLFLTGTSLLQSCDFSHRIDTTAAVKEMNERQVKRILPSQLTGEVDEWGKAIAQELNKDLVKSLSDKALIDTLAKRYRVEITAGTPLKLQSPSLDRKVNEILDAYQYNAEAKNPQIDNVQKTDDGSFFYFTSPILVDKKLANLSKKVQTEIATKTNLDSLSFRKQGDFVGLWMIKFSKKEVIRLTDVKKLKSTKITGK